MAAEVRGHEPVPKANGRDGGGEDRGSRPVAPQKGVEAAGGGQNQAGLTYQWGEHGHRVEAARRVLSRIPSEPGAQSGQCHVHRHAVHGDQRGGEAGEGKAPGGVAAAGGGIARQPPGAQKNEAQLDRDVGGIGASHASRAEQGGRAGDQDAEISHRPVNVGAEALAEKRVLRDVAVELAVVAAAVVEHVGGAGQPGRNRPRVPGLEQRGPVAAEVEVNRQGLPGQHEGRSEGGASGATQVQPALRRQLFASAEDIRFRPAEQPQSSMQRCKGRPLRRPVPARRESDARSSFIDGNSSTNRGRAISGRRP
jgi:hypothetical protein